MLIFGAGTDYSLLLVHRYREELEPGRRRRGALPAALREALPAIAASAGTVIAAMLVLLVADLQSTHWLGPDPGDRDRDDARRRLHPAAGAALAARRARLLAADRTLGHQSAPDLGVANAAGRWERVAGLVRRRSAAIVVTVIALLAVLSLGNLVHHGTIGFGQGETKPTNSSRGTEALERHFPAGLGSPLTAVVATEQLGAGDARHGTICSPSSWRCRSRPPAKSSKAVVVLVLAATPTRATPPTRSTTSANGCTRSTPAACSAASRQRTSTSSRPTPATRS